MTAAACISWELIVVSCSVRSYRTDGTDVLVVVKFWLIKTASFWQSKINSFLQLRIGIGLSYGVRLLVLAA